MKMLEHKNGNVTATDISSWIGSIANDSIDPQTLYSRVGWLARCVRIRALALMTLPFSISYKGKELFNETATEFGNYDFLSNLESLLFLSEASLILAGASYAVKVRERGKITRLHYAAPQTMHLIIDQNGINRIDRRTSFGASSYAPDEVLHVFDLNPFNEIGVPIPEITGVENAGLVLKELTSFMAGYAKRGLIKGTILSVDLPNGQHVSESEKTSLKTKWRNFLRGSRKEADQAEVFSGAVKPIVVGEGFADFNNSPITSDQRKDIATSLGIPQSLLMSDPLAGGTAEAEQLNFYLFTVLPRAKMLAKELNRQLFKEFGMSFAFEPNRMEIFQRYELQKAQQVTQLVGKPVMTINEGRELIGLDPIKNEGEMSQEQKSEIKAWKTKLAKNPNAKFETKHIPQEIETVIRERLSAKMSIDEVFKPPFEDF